MGDQLEPLSAFDNQRLQLENLLLASRDFLIAQLVLFSKFIEKLFQHLGVHTGHDS